MAWNYGIRRAREALLTLLALDTSSSFSTVAVLEGRAVRATLGSVVDRHETTLLARIETALSLAGTGKADLRALAVGTGPGGFTAVRVGLSTVKGLALALGLPVVGISSLAALARSVCAGAGVVATLVNAHRDEVFAAAYFVEGEGMTELLAPTLASPADAVAAVKRASGGMRMIAAGDGLIAYPQMVELLGDVALLPEAQISAVALGLEAERKLRAHGADDLAALVPAYVRPSDAKLPQKALDVAHVSKTGTSEPSP